jgi:nucleoside-diphosphate-sugar epimerase
MLPQNRYYDDVNLTGAENVCNACKKLGIKSLIFTSSVAVYGFAPIGTDETGKSITSMTTGALNGLRKKSAVLWLAADSRNSLTIIRPIVIFGEQNRGMCITCYAKLRGVNFLMVWKGDQCQVQGLR